MIKSSTSFSSAPVPLTPTELSNLATYGNTLGVKTYVALLTQTGTDAPVATVLENTLGGTVVWTRDDAGIYLGTLAGVFTANKTWGTVSTPYNTSTDSIMSALFSWVSANVVQINSRLVDLTNQPPIVLANTDDVLAATSVEILVYP